MKPDLSRYRPAINQTEVMLSKYVVILDDKTEFIKHEGTPQHVRAKWKNWELFYREIGELMKLKKVYVL